MEWSPASETGERRFKSCRPDFSCPAARWSCNPLLTGGVQVRVLPGQLIDRDVLLGEQPASKTGPEGSTPSVLALCVRGRTAEAPPRHGGYAGATPAGHSLMVSWSSGVLATLTWWRTLVRIQPRLLRYSRGPAATAPGSHRGERRFESCREYCGVDWSQVPARSHKPSDIGSNPISATVGGACAKGARVLRTHPAMGSIPIVSTDRARGPTGRRRPGVPAMRVQLPPGPLIFGRQPDRGCRATLLKCAA